jgi:DNA-binding NarL/FixJ family response regulator
MNKQRIFIACADERLRIALLLFLEEAPGLTVVGFNERLQSLLPQLDATQADIVLLEWQLDCQALFELLASIHGLAYPHKIIYFSNNMETGQKVLANGADYVILKNAPPDELLPILDQISLQTKSI